MPLRPLRGLWEKDDAERRKRPSHAERGNEGDLFSGGNLVVETDDRKQLFESELRFPEELLEDPGRFNQIVESMTKLVHPDLTRANGSETTNQRVHACSPKHWGPNQRPQFPPPAPT